MSANQEKPNEEGVSVSNQVKLEALRDWIWNAQKAYPLLAGPWLAIALELVERDGDGSGERAHAVDAALMGSSFWANVVLAQKEHAPRVPVGVSRKSEWAMWRRHCLTAKLAVELLRAVDDVVAEGDPSREASYAHEHVLTYAAIAELEQDGAGFESCEGLLASQLYQRPAWDDAKLRAKKRLAEFGAVWGVQS